ncbi:hypothetical protein Pmani_013380 [Petrolisthes manimaculis]|uniref:Fibronectin type-III domain-containing protein n=1 Tax=Petrolisthes manimaculis TaxID=1843537 RepID=A0AAE1PV74_9EUCA|nr:hypothetical protein Pmani_013380 [Petrolisthes manimaculis]
MLLLLLVEVTGSYNPLHSDQNDVYDHYRVSNKALEMKLVANSITIDVIWNIVENATKYNIVWSEVANGKGGNETVNSSTIFYTIENLLQCTDYLVSVEAVQDGMQLEMEGDKTQTKPQVSALRVTPLMDEPTLMVTWIPVSTLGNCNITYTVTWNYTSNNGDEGTINTSEAYYNITDLSYYTMYKVCVTSLEEDIAAAPICKTARTATGIPGPPTNVLVSASTTPKSLVVEWDPPDVTNGLITNYFVTWSPDGPSEPIITNETTYTLTGLQLCTTYNISVSASTSKGSGTPSDTSGTTQAVAPGSPTDLHVAMMVNQSDSLAMNWSQAEVQGKCDITGNIVTWSASNTDNQEMIEPTENYTITGLDPWTTYNVCVSAVNLEGQSSFPPCVNQTTDEDIPGSPPQNVRVSGTSTARSISVEWEPPVSPNGVLLEYLVTRSSVDDSSSFTITTPGTTCTLSGLLPCTTYTIVVSATTSKGSGPPGDTIAATDPVALEAPRNLTESQHTQTNITVTWTSPPDEPNCVVTNYLLRWNDTMESLSLSPSIYKYTITDLTPATTYTIFVAAENEAGIGTAAVLEASTSSEKDARVWIIVGSTVAGLVVLTLLLVAVIAVHTNKKRNKAKNKANRQMYDIVRNVSFSYL